MTQPTQPDPAAAKRELLAKLLLDKHRQCFPTLEHKTYLNFGAQGLLCQQALDAMAGYHQSLLTHAPFSMEIGMTNLQVGTELRRGLCAELGIERGVLALTENTSLGCDIALWGQDWQRGDRVLATTSEYPGVMACLREAASRHGFEIDTIGVHGNDGDWLQQLDAALTPRTKMFIVSHITWDTGRILPLPGAVALCRDRGVRVLVDGAQSVGVLPLNLDQIDADYYAFTGHKWMCGPEGVGGLFIAQRALDGLRPTFIGWRGIDFKQSGLNHLHGDGRRYEIGTSSMALQAGLKATLDTLNLWGDAAKRFAEIRRKSAALWEALAPLEQAGLLKRNQQEAPQAGLVFFTLTRGDQAALVRRLEAKQVFVRVIPSLGVIRASVHYLTVAADLERLVGVIADFCKGGAA